ncbi:MAG: DEAD/DEAH box helicase family protein [Nitrospirota bacterium]|nr:DEAD/DEAH box helicase family protein [Nitrospirota bacterium]
MALHPDFPSSPYAILDPELRWFPGDDLFREQGYQKLLPPLVHHLRIKVKEWRDRGYDGATPTSKALLQWWFKTEHLIAKSDGPVFNFRYYFAQREAVETVIYLYDVVQAKDKYDLMRFDASGAISAGMFPEDWLRLVVKMATGAGKTKVLSLILTWCYFHKLYEPGSFLARNFLVIAPNIIVLDRIRSDFDGLKIFYQDPLLPDNGYEGQNWHDDFQLTLHIQDKVHVTHPVGNIFLTNVHRVYSGDETAASANDTDLTDYFLGEKPVAQTSDNKVDLGVIIRDIDELVVLNDEAHHIHDERMAWFQSIQDIHNKLKLKDHFLSLQVDVTATPRDDKGAIFVQTVSDYPLVEAIYQNVVKHPVLPDAPSRAKLVEKQSSKFTERYEDYLHLGVEEWRKASEEHKKVNKKAILFVMTDDTTNCDEAAEWLERNYQCFHGAVLTIHTNKSGDISENKKGKDKDELDILREQANNIDGWDSPYKAIVSVMMLKEGWDVRNVTTVVGLRAYSSKSNILPEQTLGRGLRRMYYGSDVTEYVSVVGSAAFMEFVESIQNEGVELERSAMGAGAKPKSPVVIEVDQDNSKKDLDHLDIKLPRLTPRIYREYKNLEDVDVASFNHTKVPYRQFSETEQREIVFRDIATGEPTHTTILMTTADADHRSVVGFFAQTIKKDLHLVGGYDVLYGKVKDFIQNYLFDQVVNLDSLNTFRNLSEIEATRTIQITFKEQINKLTIQDHGTSEIKDYIKLKQTRPFVTNDQACIVARKSIFNKIIGDSQLELEFAAFLEGCDDIISYAKNYMAVGFKIDYVNAKGDISNYHPDFFVKKDPKNIFIIETKGLEDLDVPLKIERLKQWCADINSTQTKTHYDFVFVDEASFKKYQPKTFTSLAKNFTQYKP